MQRSINGEQIEAEGLKELTKRTDKASKATGVSRARHDTGLLLRCEEPNLCTNSKISGFSCVRGWAAPKRQIEKIELFIDGLQISSGFYGFVRPDVIRAHPELGADAHLGFAFRVDTRNLALGMRTVRVIVTARDGKTTSLEGNVEVVSQEASQINNSASSARVHESVKPRTFGSSEAGSISVSVIIFCRNQAEILDRSLPIIVSQKTAFRFDIIGFDTESEDGTADVLKRYGARVVSVRRNEFHHVRTRLSSLSEAPGEFVVFLVGDAIPADEHWLDGLVQPLIQDPLVAAVYSRQLPAVDCVPWEARDIYSGCSVVREVKQVDWSKPAEVENYRKHQWKFISFSDVSACYRRALLRTLPILDALPEVEDQYWCKCLLERGYRVILEPTSLVIHSHNHSLRELYRRQVRFGRCFATFMDAQPQPMYKVLLRTIEDTFGDLFFIAGARTNWLRKCKWAIQAPVMRFAKRYGLSEGLRLGGFGAEEIDRNDLDTATASDNAMPAEQSK